MFAHFKTWKLFSTTILFAALWQSVAFAAPPTDISFDVSLRGTGSATIHAAIFNNPRANRGVITVLAVHGLVERGSMFAPLAGAIYADATLTNVVKRIVAIDLVGHGDSSAPTLPSPLKFQDLTIEDNISVVIQSIDKLRAANLGAQVIMGHSMGGLAVQGAQEALLQQGSSLAKHGVFGAILIAAVPNGGSVWTQGPPADLSAFVVNDPILGLILDLPAALGPAAGGFTTLAGTIVPNAPSAATFIANDWIAPEPITVLGELVGVNPVTRPFTRQNAFALRNGTILTVLSFSQDVLVPAGDQDDLYTYLTGLPSTGLTLYRPIVAADAVHSMFVSNPTGLLSALKNGVLH